MTYQPLTSLVTALQNIFGRQSDGTAVTQVTGTVPLPTGASTSAKQDTGNTSLSSIDGKITAVNTGNVTVGSSALPTGASTAANQATGNTTLASILSAVTGTLTVAAHAVTQSGSWVLSAGSAIIGKVGIDQTTPGTTNKVSIGTDGQVASTQSGTWTVQPGNTANTTAWKVDGSAVTQPVSAASLPLPSGAATSANQTTQATSLSNIDTNAGATTDAVVAAGAAGTIAAKLRRISSDIGGVLTAITGTLTVGTHAVTQSGGPWSISNTTATSGGATPTKLVSAATTNATSVKASAATLYGIEVFNTNAAVRYLKLYNKASAPTVGTDTPVKVITIPGSTTGAGVVVALPPQGVAFGTGLAFALTTGATDADTTAVAASEIIVNLDYA